MSAQEPIEESDIISGLDVRYLKFSGFWRVINDYRTTGKRNAILKLSVFITFILAMPYTVFQFFSYFYIKVDLQKATILNLNIMPGLQLFCKVFVFWVQIDSNCRLANVFKKDFIVFPVQKKQPIEELHKKISRWINVGCGIQVVLNVFITTYYVTYPDTSVDYILNHTGNMYSVTTGRKKILGGWYPFPMDESPYYEYIFIYEATFMVLAMILYGIYFTAYFQLLFCLYAQFLALGYHVETLSFDQEDDKIRPRDDKSIPEVLRNILKDHQTLLRYSEELRGVYNPLVTMTLGIGVLLLIVGAMQYIMGKNVNPLFFFKIMSVILYQIAELSMFCYGSSFIETASSDLQFAAYSSEWYTANITMRKALLIMMTRTRSSSGLTAFRMYPVNRETLMSVLQFIYSTSTLMSRMAE